ncbi:hypothetical protein ACGFNU_02245 [Spirillospora sp. NPDC048911]|uniref:hypothetical protein n=1 Tax=Spirillospora sp. NPDC048911 TaxID=3364527 RepID=UPI00371CEC25
MKALLWLVLAAGLATNVFFSLTDDGAVKIAVNITTGVLVLAAIAGLVMLRTRSRRSWRHAPDRNRRGPSTSA